MIDWDKEVNELKLQIIVFIAVVIIGSMFLTYKAVPFIEIILEDEVHPAMITEGPARESQSRFLEDVSKLITYASDSGIELTGGELQRTVYQQRRNMVKGISWTMNSKHLQRRAIDLFVFIDNEYKTDCASYEPLGVYWENLDPHNRFGGRFGDSVHFERMDSEMSDAYRLKPMCKH